MIKKFILFTGVILLCWNYSYANECKIIHKSIKYYDSQVREDISNVCMFYNLANEYYLKKEYQKSLDTYKDIISLYPKEEKAYIERAKIFNKFNKYDNENQEYANLVKNVPNSVTGNLKMALIYENILNYDEALKYINKAIGLSKEKKSEYYLYKADILKESGNYYEAIKYYEKFIEENEKFKCIALYDIAKCYKSLGNTEKEKEYYAKWQYSTKSEYSPFSNMKNKLTVVKSNFRKSDLY